MTIRTLPGRQFGPETILVTGAAGPACPDRNAVHGAEASCGRGHDLTQRPGTGRWHLREPDRAGMVFEQGRGAACDG
jgi:hypothetical protein